MNLNKEEKSKAIKNNLNKSTLSEIDEIELDELGEENIISKFLELKGFSVFTIHVVKDYSLDKIKEISKKLKLKHDFLSDEMGLDSWSIEFHENLFDNNIGFSMVKYLYREKKNDFDDSIYNDLYFLLILITFQEIEGKIYTIFNFPRYRVKLAQLNMHNSEVEYCLSFLENELELSLEPYNIKKFFEKIKLNTECQRSSKIKAISLPKKNLSQFQKTTLFLSNQGKEQYLRRSFDVFDDVLMSWYKDSLSTIAQDYLIAPSEDKIDEFTKKLQLKSEIIFDLLYKIFNHGIGTVSIQSENRLYSVNFEHLPQQSAGLIRVHGKYGWEIINKLLGFIPQFDRKI